MQSIAHSSATGMTTIPILKNAHAENASSSRLKAFSHRIVASEPVTDRFGPRSMPATTAALVLVPARQPPWGVLRNMSWDVLALVAGLFVLVAALGHAGLTADLARGLRQAAAAAPQKTFWAAGLLTAFGCNLVNNLPAGLLAGRVVQVAHVPESVRAAVLIGVDLGPNLSVTGSLATILWLTALRREDIQVSAWRFLKLGAMVMPPALILAIAGAFVLN